MWCQKLPNQINKQKKKKILKKNFEKNFFWNFFLKKILIFSSDKSTASGKVNVRFLVSPDFEHLLDFRTGRDLR